MKNYAPCFLMAAALCCGQGPTSAPETPAAERPQDVQANSWPPAPGGRHLEYSLVYGLSDTHIMAKRLGLPVPEKSARYKYCLDLRPETGQAFVSFPHHGHGFIELKTALVEDTPEAKIVDFTLPDRSKRRALILRHVPQVQSAGIGYIFYFFDSCPNPGRTYALSCNDGGGRVLLQRNLKTCVEEYRRLYYE